jgi:zinc/manganese transport system substrate-binding protein
VLKGGFNWGLALTLLFSSPALAQDFKAIASFSIIGDMVREVGGTLVSVTTLVGPNGDAHVYEPTPKDAQAAAAAQIIFVNGLGFEGWLTRLVRSLGNASGSSRGFCRHRTIGST